MVARPLDEIFREICTMEAPLATRLSAYSEAVRAQRAAYAAAYDDLVGRLKSGQAGVAAPMPGEEMPPFVLPDVSGRLIALDDLVRDGPLVISFNRGHWCKFCRIELSAFRQALNAFSKSGARVVSIMPETRSFIREAFDECEGAISVLSDIDNSYALSLNLVIWLGDDVAQIYRENGLDLERFQGIGAWFVPIPATYVVGPDRRIVARHVDPDFRTRMEISDVLKGVEQARGLFSAHKANRS